MRTSAPVAPLSGPEEEAEGSEAGLPADSRSLHTDDYER
jgi:hypothetical protein